MDGYSRDLRKRVAAAREEGLETVAETAEWFGVSVSFVTKLMARHRKTGLLAAKPHTGGFAPTLDRRALALLRRMVAEQPDATLAELAGRLQERQGVQVSRSTICRALARLRLPLKKSRFMTPRGTHRGFAGCVGRSPARFARCRPANAFTWTRPEPRPA